MILASFIFEINLAGNVNQLSFELGSRISTTKPFATCTRNTKDMFGSIVDPSLTPSTRPFQLAEHIRVSRRGAALLPLFSF